MPTLIVSDVHEDLDRLQQIETAYFGKADRVIFLGDWFDKWGPRRSREVAIWIREHQSDERIEWLLGNHDCYYFFTNPVFRNAGYMPETQAAVDEVLDTEHRRRFKISAKVGRFVCTHAGWHQRTAHMSGPEKEQEALDVAHTGGFHSMFYCGGRCGNGFTGGPTWLDFDMEFNSIEGCPQIVGHTRGTGVRTRPSYPSGELSYCLDTGLAHVMWVSEDDGSVEIVTI